MSAEQLTVLFSDPFTSEVRSHSRYQCPGRNFYIPELGYGSVYTDTHNTLSEKMIDVGASFEETEDHIFWVMQGIVPVGTDTRQQQAIEDTDLLADSVNKAAIKIPLFLAYYRELRKTEVPD